MTPTPHRSEVDADLLRAVIGLTAQLDLPTVLRRFVQASTELTGAMYGAMSVLDAHGHPATFLHSGIGPHAARMIGSYPHGLGVLGQIPAHGTLRLERIQDHPAYRGFPPHHPVMESFLGTPVRVRSQVYGHLYLADKTGGFDTVDEELVTALASAAAVAIENAELYASSQKRERWLTAGSEITTTLLSGADEEDALILIAQRARAVAEADVAAIVLPSIGDTWMLEIADGPGSEELIGTLMPPGGRTRQVLRDGAGLVVESLSRTRTLRVEALRRFGPAMYAPLLANGRSVGVLLLLRDVGKPVFPAHDLLTAESFAAQAALALVLAEARQAQDMAALLDERERIARDLHDLAIQQLFATGMQLETVRRRAARGVDATELTDIVESALDNVDQTVRQIRSIVHALKDPDADVGILERLRREASLSRTGLGFAPSLIVTVDGDVVGADEDDGSEPDDIDRLINRDLGDDIVAVVREGLANAARHAQASSVRITVDITRGDESEPGQVVVEVDDDGAGLAQDTGRRSGLTNLAARARRHSGKFDLTHNAEGGTSIVWRGRIR